MILPYLIHVLIIMGIYVILATSLNLALGYTGLLNLGHVAFFGIGAYTSALLTKAGVPFLIALLAAGIIASLAGWLLVFATRRVKGDYLALATLGFSFVVYSLMLNLTKLTRGPLGIPGIPKPNVFGWVVNTGTEYLIFVVIIAAITLFILHRIVKSPYGRLLQAVRDDETSTKVLGKNAFKLKREAMMISAFFAGIAGSLFAHYITFIDPSSFNLLELVLVFTIVIVGGIASMKGSFIATIILLAIPEALRFLELPSSVLGPLRQIIYAVILLVILMWRPRGLMGKVDLA
ncbi:MAG: branched-chain amino acid ABC transporter permease [Candidatus Woesearchaeota archaeon]